MWVFYTIILYVKTAFKDALTKFMAQYSGAVLTILKTFIVPVSPTQLTSLGSLRIAQDGWSIIYTKKQSKFFLCLFAAWSSHAGHSD